MRSDTVADTVFAWIPSLSRARPEAEQDFQADQTRAAVGAMNPFLLGLGRRGAAMRSAAADNAPDFPDALLVVWFQVRNDGRLAGLRLEGASGWTLLDTTVQRAIVRADSLRTLQPLPRPLAGQAIDLWVVAGLGRQPDAVSLPIAVFRHSEPRVVGSQAAARLLGIAYRPQLPDSAVRAGVPRRLIIEFTVDTNGFVIPASIVPIRTEFRYLADEVLRTIHSARYAPAQIGRCKVVQRIREPLGTLLQL
jgi:hypothetical protein